MPGEEIALPIVAAAGRAVESGAKQIAADRRVLKQALVEVAKETNPFKDAAVSIAKREAIKQAAITKLYSPLARFAGVSEKYFTEEFPADMAAKLEAVPEEERVTPKASIAAPALEGLGFSLDELQLKELYLNLLRTASDSKIQDDAHPAFAQLLRQLSAPEAPLLAQLLGKGASWATVQLRLTAVDDESQGYSLAQNHFLNYERIRGLESPLNLAKIAMYVDNWTRLGLVEVDYERFLTAADAYDWVESSRFYRLHVEAFASLQPRKVIWQKGVIASTDLGKRFARAVGMTELEPPPN